MKIKGFLIVAAVIFPLSSVAAGEKPTAQESFNTLDKNKDGYISQKEAQSYKELLDSWDTADADEDGQVQMSEFSAFESGKAATFVPPAETDEPDIGAAPTK